MHRMVCVRAARSAPWYDADCREAKKQTRRLEKLYRTWKAAGDRLQRTASLVYQRQFFQRKLTDYWISSIDSCKNDARSFWRKTSTLMSPSEECVSSSLTADDFAAHFSLKIEKIRLPVRQRQRSTFDQPQQLCCRISGQSTLSRSCVCCHVLQPSAIISTQYRPGSLSVLRWCLLQSSV